ncbi:protein kinase [Candidatus Uabimicrobium sp. HlEnr_7]|uniref:protein kinase domain-containing protein n=1 Tax=Candidatus Uabimicrobium helgolandensis TaxID=3095367 RepID=UPI0035589AD2
MSESKNKKPSDDNLNLLKEKYNNYTSQRNWSKALKVLDEILDINTNADFYYKRARVYLKLSMLKEARNDLRQTISLDSAHLKAQKLLTQFRLDKEISSADTVVFKSRVDQDPTAFLEDTGKLEKMTAAATVVDSHGSNKSSTQILIQAGQRLGRYEIKKKIGSGGMGYVFQAYDIELERIVALKLLHRGDSEKQKENILKEAKTTAKLVHPNIVTIHDIGHESGNYYFSMDFIDGSPLKDLILKYNQQQLIEIFIQVAYAVNFANNEGVIHRDLKPANIMVDKNNIAKVMDFGLAKTGAVQESISQTGGQMGTPLYMAPEQVEGSKIGKYTDVYALGIILFEILTGDVPFGGDTHYNIFFQILNTSPEFPKNLKINNNLKLICFKALAKNPKNRYKNAEELVADIEKVIKNRPINIKKTSNNRKTILGSAIILLSILVYLWLQPHLSISVQKPQKVDSITTGVFPKGEQIDPEILSLNGKNIRDNTFMPGEYILKISQPGYYPINKKIHIYSFPYIIKEELKTIPRKIDIKISHDIKPKEKTPYKVTFTSLNNPNQYEVQKGDSIAPDSYKVNIKQRGFEDYIGKIHIWPDDRQYTLQVKMTAKLIPIYISTNMDDFLANIKDMFTDVSQSIQSGEKIKPGKYLLQISHPNCKTITKQINIAPGPNKYQFKFKLNFLQKGEKNTKISSGRQIVFHILDRNLNKVVTAYKIIYQANNKMLRFKDRLPIGKIKIIVQFLKYKTVRKTINVIAGKEPMVVEISLQKLAKKEFITKENAQMINGIVYKYRLYSNGKEIEDHLIKIYRGVGRYYWSIQVKPQVEKIKICAGYFFDISSFGSTKDTFFSQIEIAHLIEHLNKLIPKGEAVLLSAIESLVHDYMHTQALKNCNKKEIKKLIVYLTNLNLRKVYAARKKEIINTIIEIRKSK